MGVMLEYFTLKLYSSDLNLGFYTSGGILGEGYVFVSILGFSFFGYWMG